MQTTNQTILPLFASPPPLDTASLLRIYTDGCCNPNPGPGAWAAIIITDEANPIELAGAKGATTNNEMELTGILRAMQWLEVNGITAAIITTDSQYALGCVRWAPGWERKGWTREKGKPIQNVAVVQQIHALHQRMRIAWKWVRGHNGHRWNEMADRAADRALDALRR